MTDATRRSRGRVPRRRPWLRPLGFALALLLVFVLGLAVGQVTATDPEPEGPALTTIRTVVPVGATRETVTVTTTGPDTP